METGNLGVKARRLSDSSVMVRGFAWVSESLSQAHGFFLRVATVVVTKKKLPEVQNIICF